MVRKAPEKKTSNKKVWVRFDSTEKRKNWSAKLKIIFDLDLCSMRGVIVPEEGP